MERVYNWGLTPCIKSNLITQKNYDNLLELIVKNDNVIARGNGRCYGDSSLNNKHIVSTLKFNKVIYFDCKSGIIKAESGVLIKDLLEIIIPKGYFLAVTPGTKYVTLGGAVASNVHGKNHHKEGAFGSYTESIELINAKGEIISCSRDYNKQLFSETIGGMGLTGIIVSVTLKLRKIETTYLKQLSIKIKGLDHLFEKLEEYNSYTYSVAWVNCTSNKNSTRKSILLLGEHALSENIPTNYKKNLLKIHRAKPLVSVPFNLPSPIVNKQVITTFNFLYFNKQMKEEYNSLIHYDSFFYPLDSINNWSRVYGKKGLTQFQFVIPFTHGKEGIKNIINIIIKSSSYSPLAILKIMGDKSNTEAPISFPMPGYTLALDFKLNQSNIDLIDKLHDLVLDYGGRIYLIVLPILCTKMPAS